MEPTRGVLGRSVCDVALSQRSPAVASAFEGKPGLRLENAGEVGGVGGKGGQGWSPLRMGINAAKGSASA